MQGQNCFSRVSLEITQATGKQELRLQLGGGAGGNAEEADVFGGTATLVTFGDVVGDRARCLAGFRREAVPFVAREAPGKGSRARGTAADEGKQGRKSIPSIPWPLGSFTPFWCATPVCLRRAGKLETSRLRMRPWPGKTRRQRSQRQNPSLPRPHCCRGASGGWFTAPQILSCVLVAMSRCS
jgi:hypothetical protein